MSRSTASRKLQQPLWHRVLPCFMAFAATLVASPGHAVSIPNLPLQTGSAYPPPNIMFILDDSGSMTDNTMPDNVPNTTTVRIETQAYTRNTIYYNPATAYLPWATATSGTRLTDGMSYTSAFSSDNLASGTKVDLSSSTRTYYVPKIGADVSNGADYYRYQIPSGGADVIRSEYGVVTTTDTTPTGFPKSGLNGTTGNVQNVSSFVVPAGIDQVVIESTGGSHGTNGGVNNGSGDGANLYVRFNNTNVTNNYDCRSRNGANDESCPIDDPQQGTWYVGLYGDSPYKNVTLTVTFKTDLNRCGTGTGANDWINCTSATPTGRTVAAELANFATWYSYHRTRMKVAKAGASEAFNQLGSNLRVGYDSIWNRNPYPIPVGTNGGIFSGTNRSDWFTHLHAAVGDDSTPLKGALQRTGEYFKSATPWGPETGVDQISCRQNFAILTTDGYWNSTSGYTAIGDADGTAGSEIVSKDGKTTFTYAPVLPYLDNFSTTPSTQPDTLADVAMHYWKNDLRTLANNVPTSTADPAFWQHMVTFGVSIGLQGRLNPQIDLPSITNGTKHWGDPISNSGTDRIDDLWHAAVNGRGNFVTAGNATEFAQGLVNALATVAARLGSASNVTANSTSFQSDTRVYQASYVSGKWIGEVAAYEVSAAGVSTVDVDGDGNADPVWQASKNIPTTDRNIMTWFATDKGTFPTAGQVTALTRAVGLAPVTGANNAAYIAGTTTLEKRNGGTLRDRDTVLGDIANSSPMYVKDSETIFVGANDGMLHAFNALTGAERFAYVPRGIDMADLASLSDPQYVHRYFVDGPVVVSTTKQTPAKNYLVGALGRGGKGVFGLDVTTPDSFATGDMLWDSTGTGAAANMGHVLGEPLVVTLNDGSKGVIVSNGVNSSTGTASLFILDIATGAVIKELDTGATGDNGLSAPRGADVDGNGTVDYVYAGDLQGNLWKFDLQGAATGSWVVANGGAAMFVARDSADKAQPITAGVALARDPSTGKLWVFIGTGSFMTNGDLTNKDVQSMYGLIDDDAVISGRSDLVERQILVTTIKDGRTVRGFEANAASLASGKMGWYIDLDDPEAGERIVTNPRVRGAVLLTASLIPPTTNTCDAGGSGFINALDAFTGTSLGQPYFDSNGDGNYDDADTVTVGGEQVPIGSVDLGVGMPTLPTVIDNLLVVGGSKGNLGSLPVNPQGGSARRVSWHEIVRD